MTKIKEEINTIDFKGACKIIEEHTNVYLQAKQDIYSLISVLEKVDIDTINNVKSSYEGDTRVVNSIRNKYLEMLSNNETITKEMLEEEINKLKSEGKHNWNSFKLLTGIHWKLFDIKNDEDIIVSFLKNLLSDVPELAEFKYEKVFSMQGPNNQGASYFGYCLLKQEFKANAVCQLVFNISGNTSIYCYDPEKKVKDNETLINLDSDTLLDDIVEAFRYAKESKLIKATHEERKPEFWVCKAPSDHVFEEFLNESIIRVYYTEINCGDASQYKTIDELSNNNDSFYQNGKLRFNARAAIWNVAKTMSIGDVVYITRGNHHVRAKGIVIGNYVYNSQLKCHEIGVDFKEEFNSFTKAQFAQKTLTRVTERDDMIEEIELNSIKSKEIISDEYLNDYKQVIIDGAPGTGKSYGVQKEINEEGIIHERVTFYSDYEYHNFIGSIQPRLNADKVLEYKFIKGPFTKLLDQALSNLEEKHYLVIEELTRGNAAAIFGDVFQLLDRDNDGFSCYPITNNDILENLCEESAAYLEYKFDGKIVLPPNFSIICTINSSDQNVFPLDTAFKRRFDYEIESTKPHENFIDFKFSIGKIDDIEWSKFYQLLNEYILKDLNLKEDKQVGPYFIKDPKGKEQAVKSVHTKLAMYMWNDLHKVYTGSNKAIFTNVYTLADVSELFKTGKRKQILDILTEDFKKHFSLTEEPDEE